MKLLVTIPVEIKLPTEASALLEPALGHVKAEVERILSDWNDGRYPFSSEMVQDGLARVVDNAVYYAVERILSGQYGNQMVQSGGMRTSKATVETTKMLSSKGLYIRVRPNEVEVEEKTSD